MPDEAKGVVMGTAGKAASQIFAGTRQLFHDSAAPPQRVMNTGVACPVCKEQGVLLNPVQADAAGLRCNAGHTFKDTDDLMSRPHDTVPVVMPKAQQENYVSFTVQIPASALQALNSKYANEPDKMKATMAALVQHMAEPNIVIIGDFDLKRLSDVCGQPIRTAAELYGVIKGQQKTIDDLKEVADKGDSRGAQQVAGGTMLRRGELILWFDPPTTADLTERAKNAGLRLEEFIEQFVNQAKENNWF